MPAGRPQTPVEVKQLQGTFRRDRQNAVGNGGNLTLLAQIPDYPPAFDDNRRAQYQWQFVCTELHGLGMLRPIMLDWIELYCLHLSDCFKFRELAEGEGWITQFQDDYGTVTGEAVSKYVTLADGAFNKAQQVLKMLGLDPATVRKLSPAVPDKPQSKLQQMMNKAK